MFGAPDFYCEATGFPAFTKQARARIFSAAEM
jgi:hypothetical protein